MTIITEKVLLRIAADNRLYYKIAPEWLAGIAKDIEERVKMELAKEGSDEVDKMDGKD